VILAVGNFINGYESYPILPAILTKTYTSGSARGAAAGFKLDSLLKVSALYIVN
jgi:hypothetical protein